MHEGPINIHMHSGTRSTLTGSLNSNMFFSDEPGYYEDGEFGIRLETILRVVPMNLTETTYGTITKNFGLFLLQILISRFFLFQEISLHFNL